MNIVVLSGKLIDNAILRGKNTKALVFNVETPLGTNGEGQEMKAEVPCIIFNPPELMAETLVARGKGADVVLQGRVQTSRFKGPDGNEHYNTEVVIYNKTCVWNAK